MRFRELLKRFVFEDDLISAGKNHGGFSSCFFWFCRKTVSVFSVQGVSRKKSYWIFFLLFFVDFAEKQYQFFQLRVLNI